MPFFFFYGKFYQNFEGKAVEIRTTLVKRNLDKRKKSALSMSEDNSEIKDNTAIQESDASAGLENPIREASDKDNEDDNDNSGEDEEMDDLFGDDSDNAGEEELEREEKEGESPNHLPKSEANHGSYLEEDEEQAMYNRKFYGDDVDNDSDDEDSQREFKEADVEIAKHIVPYKTTSNSQDKEVYYAKVPQFLTIDPVPFDPPSFKRNVEGRLAQFSSKEDQLDDRLIDENTIRWRYSRDSKQQVFKESNAQIIQWSDGTFSLRLGDEFSDVLINDTDNTFLTVSHEQQELMQCVEGGEITKTMMFIPTSTSSKIHQRLSKAVVRREQREHLGPNTYIVRKDPELEQRELEKKQDQIIRERRKRQLKEQLEKENRDSVEPLGVRKSATSSFGVGRRNEYEEDDFLVDDEEEEEEEGGVSGEEEEEGEEEEDDDEDDLNAERLRQLKREGAAQYEQKDEDSGSEESSHKRRKIAVLDDEEEDE